MIGLGIAGESCIRKRRKQSGSVSVERSAYRGRVIDAGTGGGDVSDELFHRPIENDSGKLRSEADHENLCLEEYCGSE